MENYQEEMFDKEDLHNRFIIRNGLKPYGANTISSYVTMVKLKKAVLRASEEDMLEVNRQIFGEKLPFKAHLVNKDDLVRMMEIEEHEHVLKCLYIAQEQSIVEAIMCLLKKRECNLDQRFLRDYFLNPMDVSQRTMDDFE